MLTTTVALAKGGSGAPAVENGHRFRRKAVAKNMRSGCDIPQKYFCQATLSNGKNTPPQDTIDLLKCSS